MQSNQGEFFPSGDGEREATSVEGLWPIGFVYERGFVPAAEAQAAMDELSASIPWQQEEIMMYGNIVRVPRLTAWFGDAGADYIYSGVRNLPLTWTPLLARLRDAVEKRCGVAFNSVLLNLYRDGSDSVAWHRDDESELGRDPTIASLSLGATRRFRLRNEDARRSMGWDMSAGSLLIMSGASQRDWEHCVSKTKRQVGPRINLTFRVVGKPARS